MKILFLVNHDIVIYNFRLEIVQRLLLDGYEVHISSPYGERIVDLISIGCFYHEIAMDRHGMNPVKELNLRKEYIKLFREIKPDFIFGFTIKPNIYGSIVARKMGIPFIANITGLGTAVENKGWKQSVFILLYKYAFKKIRRVFVQNEDNKLFFEQHKIAIDKLSLLPGSGVNLQHFYLLDYPSDGVIEFAFISRIMKEKGIDQYLDAAKIVRLKHSNTRFNICGFCESEYKGKLIEYSDSGIVKYHGMIRDIRQILSKIHCIIIPSYYPEGMNNTLLESCASGRPIITTGRPGCREVVDNNVNGFIVQEKNSEDLVQKIEWFLSLPWYKKKEMGLASRAKVEREFDRQIVVEAYVKSISL